ncbi:hypothetical protein RvY_06108 [Ramazzottius varieornatus]|uniref:Uncharacterized protein n=1 Tax=Ramazzottius varieornatus TaxID=947166 RepID=A0A1D1V682_RAMVA|nr:hypothetical protein RvY_06108 [Ramazzottius varieornatus]
MDGPTWLQASLPVSMGGLGIRSTERIALPAFMASIHPVQALVLSIYPESNLDSVVKDGLDHWPHLTSAAFCPFPHFANNSVPGTCLLSRSSVERFWTRAT